MFRNAKNVTPQVCHQTHFYTRIIHSDTSNPRLVCVNKVVQNNPGLVNCNPSLNIRTHHLQYNKKKNQRFLGEVQFFYCKIMTCCPDTVCMLVSLKSSQQGRFSTIPESRNSYGENVKHSL